MVSEDPKDIQDAADDLDIERIARMITKLNAELVEMEVLFEAAVPIMASIASEIARKVFTHDR